MASSSSTHNNKIEDYVGDAKKLTMNKEEKNKYLNTTLSNNNNSSSKKKDDDILINYKWEHGRFSHPNEHFTNGVSKILSIPLNLHTVDILSNTSLIHTTFHSHLYCHVFYYFIVVFFTTTNRRIVRILAAY